MRRGLRPGQTKPRTGTNSLSRDLDWLLDQWRSSSPELRQELILAKIRAEDRKQEEDKKGA